jgi:hypothetical protein
MAATIAKEHQGHEAASDQERKEGPETKGDPAVLIHRDVAAGVPYMHGPASREDQQQHQNG